jgi:ribulose-bisphosphate carboxylase small chain
MRIMQGTFSALPDFTDDETRAQIQYAIDQGWAVAVEFTDDPHPRNFLWEMWGLPMFGIADAAAAMHEVTQCRAAYPGHYIRLSAYDASLGRQTTALSFIVNRPASEPGFRLDRQGPATGVSATPCTPTPPAGRPASVTSPTGPRPGASRQTERVATHDRSPRARATGLRHAAAGAAGRR